MSSKKKFGKNEVTCCGVVVDEPIVDYSFRDESFYSLCIKVNRRSDTSDYIDVLVSTRIVDGGSLKIGTPVKVVGELRSYSDKNNKVKQRLKLQLFADSVEVMEDDADTSVNSVNLTGYICREVYEKSTRSNVRLGYCMLAVNRNYGKASYIPILLWGRDSVYVKNLGVGKEIEITGRVQSRTYNDRANNELVKVLEVSVSHVSEVEEVMEGQDNVDKE